MLMICVIVLLPTNCLYVIESYFEKDAKWKKGIESFIPYFEMSTICFFIIHVVHSAYEEYGSDLYSYLFPESNNERRDCPNVAGVDCLSMIDDDCMDVQFETRSSLPSIQNSEESHIMNTEADAFCIVFFCFLLQFFLFLRILLL